MLSTTHRYSTRSHLFAITRIFFSALVVGVLLISSNIVYGNAPWTNHIFGYAVVGIIVALFFWGSERVWRFTIIPMAKKPLAGFDLVTQLPFWCFAGALGYTLGLIVVKKCSLLTVYEIPIKHFFWFGGIWGTIFQIIMFFAEIQIQKNFNYFHDKS
ncbi:MAG TPA: hypothetical protein VKI62_02700 [Bacteroidota bacterium]|nr:hypothetical protein [Bacteroidota bacterium]